MFFHHVAEAHKKAVLNEAKVVSVDDAESLLTQLLAMLLARLFLLLGFRRHRHQHQRLVGTRNESVQSSGQFVGIGPAVVRPGTPLVLERRTNDIVGDVERGKLSMQLETRQPDFVATDHPRARGFYSAPFRTNGPSSGLIIKVRLGRHALPVGLHPMAHLRLITIVGQ